MSGAVRSSYKLRNGGPALKVDGAFNRLDRAALALCVEATKGIRLYAGSPHWSEKNRPTLYQHITDMKKAFWAWPLVQETFKAGKKAHPARYRFVSNVLRMIDIHDLAEGLGEPYTFDQKADKALPKADLKGYEEQIVQLQYDLAQRCVLAGREQDFLALFSRAQRKVLRARAKADALTGTQHKEEVEKIFTQALKIVCDFAKDKSFIFDAKTEKKIERNNKRHWRQYRNTENAEFRAKSAAGTLVKIIDKAYDGDVEAYVSHPPEERNLGSLAWERDHARGERYRQYLSWAILTKRKLPLPPDDPADYTPVSRRRSTMVIATIQRAEQFLPHFLALCDLEDETLKVFKWPAYKFVYTHIYKLAMLGRSVIHLHPEVQEREPEVGASQETAVLFAYTARETLLDRRAKGIASSDDMVSRSSWEIAAHAIAMLKRGDLSDCDVLKLDGNQNVTTRCFREQAMLDLVGAIGKKMFGHQKSSLRDLFSRHGEGGAFVLGRLDYYLG